MTQTPNSPADAGAIARISTVCECGMYSAVYPDGPSSMLPDLRALLSDYEARGEALKEIAKGVSAHRIVSGSPGPLYTAGWNGAVEYFAERARAALGESA